MQTVCFSVTAVTAAMSHMWDAGASSERAVEDNRAKIKVKSRRHGRELKAASGTHNDLV